MSDSQPPKRRGFFRRQNDETQPETDGVLPQPPEPAEWLSQLPDADADALENLSQLSPDDVRPLVITPPEERFPPLNLDQRAAPPPQPAAEPPPPSNRRKNLAAIMGLIGVVVVGIWYALIWMNPQSALNPLPPVTPFMVVTATPGGAPAAAQIEATPVPVNTPQLSQPEPQPDALFPFILAETGVIYIANENGMGCDWMSIAGSVTGMDGVPLDGYGIRVTGDNLNERIFSGSTQTFGAGGFELPLGGAPQAGTFGVQLFTAQGAPLSDVYTVETRADCESNVAIINFLQIRDF